MERGLCKSPHAVLDHSEPPQNARCASSGSLEVLAHSVGYEWHSILSILSMLSMALSQKVCHQTLLPNASNWSQLGRSLSGDRTVARSNVFGRTNYTPNLTGFSVFDSEWLLLNFSGKGTRFTEHFCRSPLEKDRLPWGKLQQKCHLMANSISFNIFLSKDYLAIRNKVQPDRRCDFRCLSWRKCFYGRLLLTPKFWAPLSGVHSLSFVNSTCRMCHADRPNQNTVLETIKKFRFSSG